MGDLVVCADVGSTFTKVAVVDVGDGRLVATASHRTTVGTDVLEGLDAAIARAGARLPGTDLSRVLACSSAGGGLRLAVVGYEALVTAEAGRQVGLSAGARVTHVAAGPLGGAGVAALRASRPDVVLLVGGTDGGDAEVLVHNARRLAAARLRVPVVVAGNAEVRDEACALLDVRGVPFAAAANVLPRIGALEPGPARAAIREVFLRHVIGGKRLSKGRRFADLVRGATPDVVLTGVELLADHMGAGGGDLAVIDVGGATTDVYSVLTPDAERLRGPRAEVAGTLWRSRTVEGDLGVRWSATGVIEAAAAERLPVDDELRAAAAARVADPDLVPRSAREQALDLRLAGLAATIAMRRHARGAAPGETVEAGGARDGGARDGGPSRAGGGPVGTGRKDLRDVRFLIGSGGALRHAGSREAAAALAAPLSDLAGGWPLPRSAAAVVDVDYVLAPAGLLAAEHPEISARLLASRLIDTPGP